LKSLAKKKKKTPGTFIRLFVNKIKTKNRTRNTGWANLNVVFQMRWNLACRINGDKKIKVNGEHVEKKKQTVDNRLF